MRREILVITLPPAAFTFGFVVLEVVGTVVGGVCTSFAGHLAKTGGKRAHSGLRVSAIGGKTFRAK